jgi:hypothetical protein
MKTLNFDNFEAIQLSVQEMICVRGGNEGDPTPLPPTIPIKV